MTTTQAPRKAAEAHAADCREAIAAGRPRPLYAGLRLRHANLCDANLRHANLRHADLCHADLCDADLCHADLRGADLCGARVAEGGVIASVAGRDGGYYWHALALAGGGCVLQYGCDRATLAEWRTRGPEYGARYNHPPDHWATGPAVAIAAAEALIAAEAASHAVARHQHRQEQP